MAAWNLTEGLGNISVFIKMFEGTDTSKRRTETAGQSVMRMFASYEEVLKDKYRSLSRHTSKFDFFKLNSDNCASPAVSRDIRADDSVDSPTEREELYIVVCFLLGDSPASDLYMPTFRNTLSVPSSKAGVPLKVEQIECS